MSLLLLKLNFNPVWFYIFANVVLNYFSDLSLSNVFLFQNSNPSIYCSPDRVLHFIILYNFYGTTIPSFNSTIDYYLYTFSNFYPFSPTYTPFLLYIGPLITYTDSHLPFIIKSREYLSNVFHIPPLLYWFCGTTLAYVKVWNLAFLFPE